MWLLSLRFDDGFRAVILHQNWGWGTEVFIEIAEHSPTINENSSSRVQCFGHVPPSELHGRNRSVSKKPKCEVRARPTCGKVGEVSEIADFSERGTDSGQNR